MDRFEQSYNKLNAKQKEAVDALDGPVLVVAGPGTGKTELLSSRVANILSKTDTAPQNILCLTFTNKAAVNMKDRIISQAGADGAKVETSTFHSFAGEIMNLYPDRFWSAAKLSLAPDALQLDIIESIVSKLPLDHPLALKFAGQYTLLKDIAEAIKLTKEAGLTPAGLRAIINFNLAYIDKIEPDVMDAFGERLSAKTLAKFHSRIAALTRQEVDINLAPLVSLSTIINDSLEQAAAADEGTGRCENVSKWKSRWVQIVDSKKGMHAERQRNQWWLKLADVYESYRDQLHNRGFYDYSDMLVEVIAQLEKDGQIRADIQERYNYVLIDEFQDTNPAQLRLAHLVADHHSANNAPNLMAVGDDDQTIYRFNGAELNNMLGFRRSYPTAKVIVLTDNYRSNQQVLDTAQRIISQASSRLVDSDPSLIKDLRAAAKVKKGLVAARSYPSQELQLSMVGRDIRAVHRPGVEIAVLARGHASLIKMSALLQKLGVPVRYEQAANILDHEVINQAYLVARLLLSIQTGDEDSINGLLNKVIRWPAWGLEAEELWRLALKAKGKNWLEALKDSRSKKMTAFGKWLTDLAAAADSQPLAVTIEQIIGLRECGNYTSPVRRFYTEDSKKDINGYFHGLSAIQLLRALVHEYAIATEPTLAEFVRFIGVNKDNQVVLADESPFITGEHSVQLMSVHKAKGLEFDHVYIIDAIEDNWKPRPGGRRPPANLPLRPAGDDFDDYVRLLYVAATRAKSSLTITSYFQDHSGRDVGVSSIVQGALPVERVKESDKKILIEVLEENLRWPSLQGGKEKIMLAARLEEYNLYATHLLDFLDVTRDGPGTFKEKHLLYLPELKTARQAYGTAIHAAIESAQKMVNAGKFKLSSIEKEFLTTLKNEQLPETDYLKWAEQGKTTLTRLFKDFNYQLPEGSLSEQRFKGVMVGSARIGGTLDRMDKQDDTYNIVDYKTGNALNSLFTRDKTKEIRAYKHRLQLIFYSLIVQQKLGAGAGSVTGQMVYVEADTANKLALTYAPTSEDLERMTRLIKAVWGHIMTLDMPNTSGYSPDISGIKHFEDDLLSGKK